MFKSADSHSLSPIFFTSRFLVAHSFSVERERWWNWYVSPYVASVFLSRFHRRFPIFGRIKLHCVFDFGIINGLGIVQIVMLGHLSLEKLRITWLWAFRLLFLAFRCIQGETKGLGEARSSYTSVECRPQCHSLHRGAWFRLYNFIRARAHLMHVCVWCAFVLFGIHRSWVTSRQFVGFSIKILSVWPQHLKLFRFTLSVNVSRQSWLSSTLLRFEFNELLKLFGSHRISSKVVSIKADDCGTETLLRG